MVSGTLVDDGSGRLGTIRVSNITASGNPRLVGSAPVSGSLHFAVLTCQYADKVGVAAVSTSFWPTLLGTAAPSLDHYFRELSANAINFSGSAAAGTFVLPGTETFYSPGGSTNLYQLVSDCVAAADPTVNFGPYDGVFVQLNGGYGSSGAAGEAFLGPLGITVDGTTRIMRVATAWGGQAGGRSNTQAIVTHEIGHTLGWAHSGGTPGAAGYPYDSQWDVMSHGQSIFGPTSPGETDGTNWWMAGVHTIGINKWEEGWLPGSRVFQPAPGTATTITFDRSALPTGSSNYLLAIVPDPANSRAYYSVELRKFAGYDQPPHCVGGTCAYSTGLPGEGILIMHSDSTLTYPAMMVNVVDGDHNGNVNDAGAIWVAGEEFTDGFGTSIRVESIGASSAQVTISTGIPPLIITTASSLPDGLVGQAYSQQLGASNGSGSYSWSVQAGSTLPSGLNLSSGGLLSGTPTVAIASSFTLQVTSGGQTTSRAFTLTVSLSLTITTPSALPDATIGQAYSQQMQASGGSGSFTWSVQTGSSLPVGLTLSTAGLLAGTPTTSGTGGFTLQVISGTQTATRAFTLTIAGELAITTPEALPDATIGQAYSQQMQASGGSGNYVWTVQSGVVLPNGLALSGAGLLSGIPGVSGVTNLTVQLTSAGAITTKLLQLNIAMGTIVDRVLAQLAGTGSLTPEQKSWLDGQGNKNGVPDVGDLLALLDANPGVALSPPVLLKLRLLQSKQVIRP